MVVVSDDRVDVVCVSAALLEVRFDCSRHIRSPDWTMAVSERKEMSRRQDVASD